MCSSTNPKERVHLLELEPLGIPQFYSRKAITHLLMKDIEKSSVEKFFHQHIHNNGTLFNFIANNSGEMFG